MGFWIMALGLNMGGSEPVQISYSAPALSAGQQFRGGLAAGQQWGG